MHNSPWDRLPDRIANVSGSDWLENLLHANTNTAYLQKHGSPQTLQAFRSSVPLVSHDDLIPWLARIQNGEPDVLFAGRPIAFERTGGSAGGRKLIPYSQAGLEDFQRSVAPWLKRVVTRYGVTGKAYFSISPATRQPEWIGDVPIGLADGAYLGAGAAAVLAKVSAVPFHLAQIANVDRWRTETLRHLTAARDLELISVWSPTFLLQLLEGIDDPVRTWPDLKVLSCWASGASKPFADRLAVRLPHAHLQPKGLLSTEAVVTVPDESDAAVLTDRGFFEFERERRLFLAQEMVAGNIYEVVVTTASGLYRYRTGDLVRYAGLSSSQRPVLEFVGRGSLVSDLVGEKLTEPFVAGCLDDIPGFRLLVPATEGDGYVLATETGVQVDLVRIEQRLCHNPQYAHARQLGQLKAVRLLAVEHLFNRYARTQTEQGVRLGDVKPAALRNERAWIARLTA
jgi:hypothetical protein